MNEAIESKPAATVKMVEVTLKKAHTHRRVVHIAGDKIKVTERQATWLKEQGKV